jgi:Leucine-rich repeat (LRR) protein
MNRFLTIAILATALNSFSQVEPCSTYTCDSLAVRAILDSNGLTDHLVGEVARRIGIDWRIIGIDISHPEITTLPKEIGKLSALESLALLSNQLTSLPPEIGQLTALKGLILYDNQLTSLPPEIGQLTSLTELNLYGNQLTSLPPEIGQLTALVSLILDNNQLTSLPPEIGQLTALKDLILYSNQLNSLPPEIGQLTALRALDLFDNQLTSVPSEIGQLTALYGLGLDNNQLTSLPSEILNVSPTNDLEVNNNLLCSLPDYIEAWIDEYSTLPDWRAAQDCQVTGCMNVAACNYDPTATIDDGTCMFNDNAGACSCPTLGGCEATIYGCMHPDYEEYNPQANVADPYACITLGVSNNFNKSEILDFHHNPSNNSITINFPNATEDKSIFIYTLKGKLVKQFRTTGNTITWNVQESGVYYIRVMVDGRIVIRRVLL